MTPELAYPSRSRDTWTRALAAALVVSALLLAAILATTTATLGPATIALATALGVLLVALRALFAVVQILAVPDARIAAMDGEPLGLETSALRDEHRRALRAINDLAFEHSMGKIGDADHRELSTAYRLRAIELMRALDKDRQLSPSLRAELSARGVKLAEVSSVAPEPTASGDSAAHEPFAEQPAQAANPGATTTSLDATAALPELATQGDANIQAIENEMATRSEVHDA